MQTQLPRPSAPGQQPLAPTTAAEEPPPAGPSQPRSLAEFARPGAAPLALSDFARLLEATERRKAEFRERERLAVPPRTAPEGPLRIVTPQEKRQLEQQPAPAATPQEQQPASAQPITPKGEAEGSPLAQPVQPPTPEPSQELLQEWRHLRNALDAQGREHFENPAIQERFEELDKQAQAFLRGQMAGGTGKVGEQPVAAPAPGTQPAPAAPALPPPARVPNWQEMDRLEREYLDQQHLDVQIEKQRRTLAEAMLHQQQQEQRLHSGMLDDLRERLREEDGLKEQARQIREAQIQRAKLQIAVEREQGHERTLDVLNPETGKPFPKQRADEGGAEEGQPSGGGGLMGLFGKLFGGGEGGGAAGAGAEGAAAAGEAGAGEAIGGAAVASEALAAIAGPAAIAVIGIAAIGEGALIAGKEIERFSEYLDETARRLSQYNGMLAGAEAQAGVNQILGDIRRGQKLAPELSEFVAARSQLSQVGQDLVANLIKPVIPLVTQFIEWVTGFLQSLNKLVEDNMSTIVDTLNLIIDAVNTMAEYVPWISIHLDHIDKKMPKKEDPVDELLKHIRQLGDEIQRDAGPAPAMPQVPQFMPNLGSL